MPTIGATIAIMQDGRILLTRREDFEVWCLPGGAVDPGESVAQTAIREAREETGLDVELTHLVGIYSKTKALHGGNHLVLFAARPAGGAVSPANDEVIEMDYFDLDELPRPLMEGHEQQIRDALGGKRAVVWAQNAGWRLEPAITRQEIYAMRDRSGLSRQQFYLEHAERVGPENSALEVGGTRMDESAA